MELYDLVGTYDFQGKTNNFKGQIKVGLRKFEGTVIDPSSICPEQKITGVITEINYGNTLIEFLKISDLSFGLAPIRYQLIKALGGITGDYEGAWKVAVNPEDCGSLGIGYRRGIGEVAIWIPEKELENKATLGISTPEDDLPF